MRALTPELRQALIGALIQVASDLETSRSRGEAIADEAGITRSDLRSACELGALRSVVEHGARDIRAIVDAYLVPRGRR